MHGNKLRVAISQSLQRWGLHAFVTRYARRVAPSLAKNREYLGQEYIRSGAGLEIGALHNPLPVGEQAHVRYVDRISFETCLKHYPELDPTTLVRPEIIDDGFELVTIAEESNDFVIANHVLEHSPNPLQVLRNWSRVLKPAGLLFISVPVAETCFDKDRPLTTAAHILVDYSLCAQGKLTAFRDRNLAHYREWVQFSEPRLLEEKGRAVAQRSAADVDTQARALWQAENEIHFHTFSEASFRELLDRACTEVLPDLSLYAYEPIGGEIVAVLRKADAARLASVSGSPSSDN